MTPNILLVEDSPATRNILKIYLMSLRVNVVEAGDAARALQIARLVPFALVLAEAPPVGMDTGEFLEQLRSGPLASKRGLPIVLMVDAEAAEEAQELVSTDRASAYVRKPVAHLDLTRVVQPLLPARP